MRTACASSETGTATTEEWTTQRKETYATFGSDGGGACRCDGARGGACLLGGGLPRRGAPPKAGRRRVAAPPATRHWPLPAHPKRAAPRLRGIWGGGGWPRSPMQEAH